MFAARRLFSAVSKASTSNSAATTTSVFVHDALQMFERRMDPGDLGELLYKGSHGHPYDRNEVLSILAARCDIIMKYRQRSLNWFAFTGVCNVAAGLYGMFVFESISAGPIQVFLGAGIVAAVRVVGSRRPGFAEFETMTGFASKMTPEEIRMCIARAKSCSVANSESVAN